jgi:pyruvate dehydrogenase E1 component alpha subunit
MSKTKTAPDLMYQKCSDQLWKMYEDMLLMRRFEERVIQLYQEKYIAGFCHTYIGQEAVLVGAMQVMQKGDPMMTGYRCHAHALAAGCTPREVMAELVGRVSGCSGGKGGSMHLYNIPAGFYGGHGIVGAYTAIGTGIALAEKYKKTGKICFTFFGDGASNQGQVYESYNMASLWKLPVIYIIENNRYGIGTSSTRSCAGGPLYERAAPFGIPGWHADGMDVFDIIAKMELAEAHVRGGNGPAVVECATYRYKGHSVSDPANYRSKEEVDGMKLQDPILKLEEEIKKTGDFSEERKAETSNAVMQKVRDAADFAKSEPEPGSDALWKNVYAT